MIYFSVRSCLISFFVLVFLLFVGSSNKVVEVNAICKQAKNPSFCLSLLNSKPGGATHATLIDLAQYTIGVLRANVTITIKYINLLIAHSGTDRKAINHYKSCLTHFSYNEGALGDVENTQKCLRSGDYNGVNVAASAVMTDVEDCISGESPSNPSYHDPSMLPKYADVVKQIAQIILILSNFLIRN
ncbi:pectinesterase inhibitor 1-like [Gastrolobium bilobum]|uniref:pectinesterase inhibitor 1-like n=1 Tax=Gastrolobium bilobum TaxID=150636 RepID=UPI002AB1920C|nr:pectinesterase inhibitor 1-like [Gastrolobium bilobum]